MIFRVNYRNDSRKNFTCSMLPNCSENDRLEGHIKDTVYLSKTPSWLKRFLATALAPFVSTIICSFSYSALLQAMSLSHKGLRNFYFLPICLTKTPHHYYS